ncbi:methyltransferase domain-containing protein [Streptomyces marincola]|uniref:Trans-aconitate methyltransferase n=1 Tax=Streptomyces marincola TaxID=2878388 RepID=A0A1W7CVW3_9ACTN|nr:methyltransferase domain-containing protein [Streptomyces marincola]ARQ68809.1 trans-aconitate methyltransferase [Streptomyces marincola]
MYSTLAPERHRALGSGPRTRPFYDLLSRLPDDLPGRPARIVDLGCGTGELTSVLAERWPDARITGLDISGTSLAESGSWAGPTPGGGHLAFGAADIAEWEPKCPLDMVFSNAAIQWVPRHQDLFATWTRTLAPGGIFAFQVPDNAAARSHVVLREVCASPRWRERLGPDAVQVPDTPSPAVYLDRLAGLGFTVDTWETTYSHILPAEDPFGSWVRGTGMRPLLAALADEPGAGEAFLADYRARLGAAYPAAPHGTVFTFRRVFVVARRGGAV